MFVNLISGKNIKIKARALSQNLIDVKVKSKNFMSITQSYLRFPKINVELYFLGLRVN